MLTKLFVDQGKVSIHLGNVAREFFLINSVSSSVVLLEGGAFKRAHRNAQGEQAAAALLSLDGDCHSISG